MHRVKVHLGLGFHQMCMHACMHVCIKTFFSPLTVVEALVGGTRDLKFLRMPMIPADSYKKKPSSEVIR